MTCFRAATTISAFFVLVLGGCKVTGNRSALVSSVIAPIPPVEEYDFMGCRKDAIGCDSDCTKLSGVTMEVPDICPKGGFDGTLACFCEKDPVR